MLTILLSILCSALVYAAPPLAGTTTVPWNALKDDTSLGRFQSTLLNQTLLTFLNDCYRSEQPSTIQISVPCSRYFDAILQLNSTDFVVQQPAVEKLLNEPNTDVGFCKQNYTFPAMKYYTTITSDFSEPGVCGFMCIDSKGETLVPKPICVFLAWLGEEIKNQSAVQSSNVPKMPENAPNSNDSLQTSTKTGKNPEKSIVTTSNNTISQPIQSLKNDKVNESIKPLNVTTKLNNIKPALDVAQRKDEISENKQNAANPEAAAPEIIAPPVKEENQEMPPQINPPLGTEKADEESLTKDTANAEKTDSSGVDTQLNEEQQNDNESGLDQNDDINQDDDNDEDEDHDALFQKPKQLQNMGQSDADQKDVVIVEGNLLSKVKHVTDPFQEESGSNFFTYFLFGMFLCIVMYVVYHNKSKILALLLEGRRSDKGRGGRRKHTAAYRKLDSNLEEAITSSASGRITQIIY